MERTGRVAAAVAGAVALGVAAAWIVVALLPVDRPGADTGLAPIVLVTPGPAPSTPADEATTPASPPPVAPAPPPEIDDDDDDDDLDDDDDDDG